MRMKHKEEPLTAGTIGNQMSRELTKVTGTRHLYAVNTYFDIRK